MKTNKFPGIFVMHARFTGNALSDASLKVSLICILCFITTNIIIINHNTNQQINNQLRDSGNEQR